MYSAIRQLCGWRTSDWKLQILCLLWRDLFSVQKHDTHVAQMETDATSCHSDDKSDGRHVCTIDDDEWPCPQNWFLTQLRTTDLIRPELDMDWIHPWIRLDWIGSDDCNPLFFFIYIFSIINNWHHTVYSCRLQCLWLDCEFYKTLRHRLYGFMTSSHLEPA